MGCGPAQGRARLAGRGRLTDVVLATAVVLVLSSGATIARAGDRPSTRGGPARTGPSPGCALGASGPTLDPAAAARQARSNALSNLALAQSGLRIRSDTRLLGGRVEETTHQTTRGRLVDVRLAGLWTQEGVIADRPWREVRALACRSGVRTDLDREGDDIGGTLSAGRRPGPQRCAIGIAGPTLSAADQPARAGRDARRLLAELIESRFVIQIRDDGQGPVSFWTRIEASERARARVRTTELEASWLDLDGTGPLRRPGVLYGRICIALDSGAAGAGP